MPFDTVNVRIVSKPKNFQYRVLTLMNYNVSKTSGENFLDEQVMGLPILGGPSLFGGKTTKIMSWVNTWDKHDWLNFGELVALGIAMATPVGWVGLGANLLALSFGGANAATYWNEGDKYMAGMIAFFSLIPAAQLAKQFKSISKYGPQKAFEAMQAVKKGAGTTTQKQIAKEVSEELGNKGKLVNQMLGSQIKKEFFDMMSKASTRAKVAVLALAKLAGFTSVGVLTIGGMTYSWDTIYGLMGKNEKEIDQKSPLRQVLKFINQNPQKLENQAMISLDNLKKSGDIKYLNDLKKIQIQDNKKILDSLYLSMGSNPKKNK